jgi:hypothetical protein
MVLRFSLRRRDALRVAAIEALQVP